MSITPHVETTGHTIDMEYTPIAWENLEGQYDTLAQHLNNISKQYLLFHTDVKVTSNMFRELLVEEDRQIMACSCCNQYFNTFGNMVYLDADNVVRSALFHDIKAVPPKARALFNELGDRVVAGKIVGIFNGDGKYRIPVAGQVAVRIGNKTAGGFPHFYGLLSANNVAHYTNDSFEDLVQGLTNLATKYKGLVKFYDAIDAVQSIYGKEADSIPGELRKLSDVATTINYAVTEMQGKSFDKIAMAMIVNNVPGWKNIFHFNGSALGTLVSDFVTIGKWAETFDRYLEITSPTRFRQRKQEAINLQNLEKARKIMTEQGTMSALINRPAQLSDIETLWTPEPVESDAEAVAEPDIFEQFISKIKEDEAVTLDDMRLPTKGKSVIRSHFIEHIVPSAKAIRVKLRSHEMMGYLIRPVDNESKPIYFWDLPEQRRPYVTCVNNTTIPLAYFGLKAGWNDLVGIAELPWTGEHITDTHKLTEGWMLMFDASNDHQEKLFNLTSIGGAVNNSLYPFRASIDAVFKATKLATNPDNKLVSYVQLSNRHVYTDVAVKDESGEWQLYTILDA